MKHNAWKYNKNEEAYKGPGSGTWRVTRERVAKVQIYSLQSLL